MRLAEACGIFDVDAMLLAMHPSQFDEWLAKDAIEPIGQAGVTALVATIAALLGSHGDRTYQPHEVKESCLIDGQNWRPLEPVQQVMTAAQAAAAMGIATGGK